MIEDVAGNGPLILVIEDDRPIRRFLKTTLISNGYRFLEASTAAEGLKQVGLQHPDLIILDLGLPDLDGLDVAKQLREWTTTPIIILTVRDQEHDKVEALDRGADDYLTKPFGTSELLARIRVALRHAIREAQGHEESVFSTGSLRVDLAHRRIFIEDDEVHLTPIEYKLLTTLIRHAGKVVTGHQLLKEVWGPGYTNESQYLRVYMGHLRHKLEKNPTQPRYLITELGVGYRLQTEET
jgi:two-component system, OmpR family, KDP operon response regulator KdpE